MAHSFKKGKVNGILISNFSSKDANKILESKSKEPFEIDFIFLAENSEMWIIEVRKSQPNGIATSIEEKFAKAISNRNHILQLADKMFGKEFSIALRNICNCLVAIPEANAEDFERFKNTETWESFASKNPSYKVRFVSKNPSFFIECISTENTEQTTFWGGLDLMKIKRFYAALTLVKTSLSSFHQEQFLSSNEKKQIAKITNGMNSYEYHITLSPEQCSILEELPTHLQVFGEAATGKTELLKAVLFKILKSCSIPKDMYNPESRISKISQGLELILFIIFGDRPYLKNSFEKFISYVDNKLNLSQKHKPVIEVHIISECSPTNIDGHLMKLLKRKDYARKNTFILIDECYHHVGQKSLSKLYECKGCCTVKKG